MVRLPFQIPFPVHLFRKLILRNVLDQPEVGGNPKGTVLYDNVTNNIFPLESLKMGVKTESTPTVAKTFSYIEKKVYFYRKF